MCSNRTNCNKSQGQGRNCPCRCPLLEPIRIAIRAPNCMNNCGGVGGTGGMGCWCWCWCCPFSPPTQTNS